MAAGLCDAGVPLPAGVLGHPLGWRQEEECKPSKTAGKEIKRKQFYSFFTVSLYTDPHTKNLMFLILKTLSYILLNVFDQWITSKLLSPVLSSRDLVI